MTSLRRQPEQSCGAEIGFGVAACSARTVPLTMIRSHGSQANFAILASSATLPFESGAMMYSLEAESVRRHCPATDEGGASLLQGNAARLHVNLQSQLATSFSSDSPVKHVQYHVTTFGMPSSTSSIDATYMPRSRRPARSSPALRPRLPAHAVKSRDQADRQSTTAAEHIEHRALTAARQTSGGSCVAGNSDMSVLS